MDMSSVWRGRTRTIFDVPSAGQCRIHIYPVKLKTDIATGVFTLSERENDIWVSAFPFIQNQCFLIWFNWLN